MMKPEQQATVNYYFMRMIEDLWIAVIDECMDLCYKKFGQYPNYQALKIARRKLRR